MDMYWIIWISIGVAAVISVCLLILKRMSSIDVFSTPEEKALVQLDQIYARYITRKNELKHRHFFYYLKRVKIIMIIYVKERFNITVKTILTGIMRNEMKNASRSEVEFLSAVFDRIDRLKTDGMTYEAVDRLFRDTIAFLKYYGKISTERISISYKK
jgi:hypothetical protein